VLRFARFLAAALLLLRCTAAAAQEPVHFSSLEDNGPGHSPTMLDGYLFRPAGEGKRAAVVFLHGCGGLFSRASGFINPRELDWARELTQRGAAVLMVDSFGPRNQGEMCSQRGFNREIYMKRPRDAYGALLFLQSQTWVRPDRVGLMGWSEGGGAVLFAIRARSLGRPAQQPQADFRAAVALYPASCNERRQGAWMSPVPLLALLGAEDVWTPAAPCKELLDGAIARGAKVEIQVYPGAYHDFDWPNMARHESPNFRTAAGVVPIQGTDPAARQDALSRVPAFLGCYLINELASP
jgi:dienelactone hydrolase